MIDAHLHLSKEHDWSQEVLRVSAEKNVRYFLVNSSSPDNWYTLDSLTTNPQVIPFYGLHPWFLKKAHADWRDELRQLLISCPRSGIGEVGLDRSLDANTMEEQIMIFEQQIKLAAELQRPLSIHCVRAWGPLTELLRKYQKSNLRFILHGFTGSLEMMHQLISLGGFISFGPILSRTSSKKLQETFRLAPMNRVFLETDYPDYRVGLPPSIGMEDRHLRVERHVEILSSLYGRAAAIHNCTKDELKRQLRENATIFTN